MTITFCLVPFIPLAVLSARSGLTYFRTPFLKGIIFYVKNYSHSRPISYDVTSLIRYFQGQGIDHATFKFLRGTVRGSKRVEYSGPVT